MTFSWFAFGFQDVLYLFGFGRSICRFLCVGFFHCSLLMRLSKGRLLRCCFCSALQTGSTCFLHTPPKEGCAESKRLGRDCHSRCPTLPTPTTRPSIAHRTSQCSHSSQEVHSKLHQPCGSLVAVPVHQLELNSFSHSPFYRSREDHWSSAGWARLSAHYFHSSAGSPGSSVQYENRTARSLACLAKA